MLTIREPLKRHQLIDIIRFDEHGKRHIRRVKVHRLTDNGDDTFHVIGVNLQGENPMEYRLPKYPSEPQRRPNTIHWLPFIDRGEGEE